MNERSSALAAAAEQAMIRLYAASPPPEAPEHEFSPRFEKAMARLTRHVRSNRYHALTRAAKVALAAAILALLLAGSALAAKQYGFSLTRFWDHARLDLEPHHETLREELTVGYIPEGFVLAENTVNRVRQATKYENAEDPLQYFVIIKYADYDTVVIDTENRTVYETVDQEITYTVSKEDTVAAVVWMRPDRPYLYCINAYNMEDSELLEIAFQAQ